MKKCHHCGTPWRGYRRQPRSRDVCEVCGKYLHSCVNCHYFDHNVTSSCTLPHTHFVGARDAMNYCEDFRMLDTVARANEDRVLRAKQTFEALFRR